MTEAPSKDSEVEERILRLVKTENPQGVQQLVELVKQELALSEKEKPRPHNTSD